MKKTHFRDYATDAFRFTAARGPAKDYRQRIYNEMLRYQQLRESSIETGISAPTEAAVIRAEQAVIDAAAELADMEAVEFALEVVRQQRGDRAVQAIQIVYMDEPDIELVPGEIKRRVIIASIFVPAECSTIYRWMALARRVFAEKRGLRV